MVDVDIFAAITLLKNFIQDAYRENIAKNIQTKKDKVEDNRKKQEDKKNKEQAKEEQARKNGEILPSRKYKRKQANVKDNKNPPQDISTQDTLDKAELEKLVFYKTIEELFNWKDQKLEYKDGTRDVLEDIIREIKNFKDKTVLQPTEKKVTTLEEYFELWQNNKDLGALMLAAKEGYFEAIVELDKIQEKAKVIFKEAQKNWNSYSSNSKKNDDERDQIIDSFKQAAYMGSKEAQNKLKELVKNIKIKSNNYINENKDVNKMLSCINKSISTGQKYYLKIGQLIVTALDPIKAPGSIVIPDNKELVTTKFNEPTFVTPSDSQYEYTVMAIDPAQQGKDETAYCVLKKHKGYYYIMEVGGMGGNYITEKNKRLPDNPEILKKIEEAVRKYQVKYIQIETNKDASYVGVLRNYLLEKFIQVEVIGYHQSKQKNDQSKYEDQEETGDKTGKENRIIKCLSDLLDRHKLVVSQETLLNDMDSVTEKNKNYRFFYQFKNISDPDLKHDDRIDAVSQAVIFLEKKEEEKRLLREEQKKKKQTFNKMYNQGSYNDLFTIGMAYKTGQGVEKDRKRAYLTFKEIFDKVPDQNDFGKTIKFKAQGELGRLMIKNQDQSQLKEGMEYLEEAAKNNYHLASYYLGNFYMKQDKDQALKEYEKAISAKYAYYNDSSERNLTIAKSAYKKAMIILPEKKSQYQAVELLKESAEKGYTPAQLKLGEIYELQKDFEQSIHFYNQAAELFHFFQMYKDNFTPSRRAIRASLRARYNIIDIYYTRAKSRNYFEAYKNLLTYVQSQADTECLDYKMASYRLANICFKSKGIKEPNLDLALFYYNQAQGMNDSEKDKKIHTRMAKVKAKIKKYTGHISGMSLQVGL